MLAGTNPTPVITLTGVTSSVVTLGFAPLLPPTGVEAYVLPCAGQASREIDTCQKLRVMKGREPDGIYLRPDSPFWWATWKDLGGRMFRRSTGVRCKDDPQKEKAKAVRAKWIVGNAEEQRLIQDAAAAPTFDELMTQYMDGPALEKKAPERDFASLRVLTPVFKGRQLSNIKGADVRAYIDFRRKKGISAETINREIGLMSAAINWANKELEWSIQNPFQGRRLKEPEGRDRWLREDEASALLRAAESLPRANHLV